MNTVAESISQTKRWQSQGLKVVLVTGVFDILHIEHIRFFDKARKSGDKLIVGLETDQRVRAIKGDNRPIYPESVRLEQITALRSVDYVFLLPTEFSTQADWTEFMRQLHPDSYAISSHSTHAENKKLICDTVGVKFQIVHDFNPDSSSTEIAQKIARLQD